MIEDQFFFFVMSIPDFLAMRLFNWQSHFQGQFELIQSNWMMVLSDIPGRRVCLFSGSRGGGSMPAPCNLPRKVKKEGFVV